MQFSIEGAEKSTDYIIILLRRRVATSLGRLEVKTKLPVVVLIEKKVFL